MEKLFYKDAQIEVDVFAATQGCDREEAEYGALLEQYSDRPLPNGIELVQTAQARLAACYARRAPAYFEAVYRDSRRASGQ